MERIFTSQLRGYIIMIENNLYSSLQSAYREFYSTETALLSVHNGIPCAIDDKNEVIPVLIDLGSFRHLGSF